MSPDPKWLEILKASGWQTTALAVACGSLLILNRAEWLPPLDPWMIQLAVLGLLVCGCLALASIGSAALKLFPAQDWLIYYVQIYRKRRGLEKYIPYMTEHERNIIAYLLAKTRRHLQSILTEVMLSR